MTRDLADTVKALAARIYGLMPSHPWAHDSDALIEEYSQAIEPAIRDLIASRDERIRALEFAIEVWKKEELVWRANRDDDRKELIAALSNDSRMPITSNMLDPVQATAWQEGWQLAHENAGCGHPRANWKCDGWPNKETPIRCVACDLIAQEREACAKIIDKELVDREKFNDYMSDLPTLAQMIRARGGKS